MRDVATTAYATRPIVILFFVLASLLPSPQVASGQENPRLPRVPEGFEAELLRLAGEGEGSWISMTFDDRGRLILGRDDAGLMRLTLADDSEEIRVEAIDTQDTVLKHCRGVLFAHESLYVSATNSNGFYRLRDTDGDDHFDETTLLKEFDYRSRYGHGVNQVVLGPDGMLYLVVGDDVSFPAGASAESPYRDPHNDWLLPNPHDAGQDNRVGYIVRTDPAGESWEILAGGLRNPFDMAFNADGEMFTYDADMEWDVGLPWYRPTRVNHVVSGGEYGWRWGTGKWPTYYADSLPSTLDTALGSPTGVLFGYASNFPPKYRDALLLGDWQNGRILAATLTPKGATYACEYEVFIQGAPLNVCDMVFGSDGALYFITGGRGSQSALYRVRYTGPHAAPRPKTDTSQKIESAAAARELRHHLESFHTRRDPQVVAEAWPHLDSPDRWLRFAARVAIERQDVEQWRSRALAESRPMASAIALLALARAGESADRPAALAALGRLSLESLDRRTLLVALRAYALWFIRHGELDPERADLLAQRFADVYPHSDRIVNRELCELLVYLEHPGIIEQTLDLLEAAVSQEGQVFYAQALLHVEEGWTIEQRRRMLVWLRKASGFTGGRLLPTVIGNMESDYLARLSDAERAALADEIAALNQPAGEIPSAPPRPFVRDWKMKDFAAILEQPLQGRSWESARSAFTAVACLKCHRMNHQGAAIGPDLTNVGNRFDERTLLESIVRPSQAIDPKYQNVAYVLESGKVVVGRPVQVNAAQVVVETNPLTQATVAVPRAEVADSLPAHSSPMPTGLVNTLSRDEVLDLLAWLKSGGDPEHAVFRGE